MSNRKNKNSKTNQTTGNNHNDFNSFRSCQPFGSAMRESKLSDCFGGLNVSTNFGE